MSGGGRDPDTYPCAAGAPHRWETTSPASEHFGETQMCAECGTLRIIPRGAKHPSDITLRDLVRAPEPHREDVEALRNGEATDPELVATESEVGNGQDGTVQVHGAEGGGRSGQRERGGDRDDQRSTTRR